ncbi:hypothetical protein NP233_g3530 [Leucocoprinus birnbaumii]|uniref:AIG1-type G domain-containing protein n=1 Tax=Leucocoprinus birnbaumii TaxID=56174 RepID=A0AAD5VWB6_9AGAR|nr:hypothetical protein NP233_g3530 [Leucocoprinus birnbaumii]
MGGVLGAVCESYHVQTHVFALGEHKIQLVDMPGFDDTSKSDTDLLKTISDFLFAEYQKGVLVHGILFFHRISDVRVGGTSKRNFTMFKKLCGEEAFENVAIVTTRWDQETDIIGNERLTELRAKPQLFKAVIDGGGEIFRHDRNEESGRQIIQHLVGKAPKSLLVQREMAEGKEVLETTAGQELQREIMEQVERHRKEMTELLEEMEEIRDEAGLAELQEECQALRNKMARLQEESQKLSGTPNERNEELHDPEQPAQHYVEESIPVDEDERLGKAIEEVKEELRVLGVQLKEERLYREVNHRRLEDIEKKLIGMVTMPVQLLTVWDRFLTVLGYPKSRV